MTSNTVREGDRYPITLTTSEDLTGATVRLLCRPWRSVDDVAELACTFVGPVVTHVLDGTLGYGAYGLEVEATWAGSPPTIVTFPTDGSVILYVQRDFD